MDFYKKYSIYKFKYLNLKKKYKYIGGGYKDNIISELLNILIGFPESKQKENGDIISNIFRVYKNLEKYIATPWNSTTKKLYELDEYNKEKEENKINCKDTPSNVLCQFHEGNLIEHSQWSAIYIIKFFDNNDDIIKWIQPNEKIFYLNFLIICAFFHDIGKGLDCILNLYDRDKFPDGNDALHTIYSGDTILNKKQFKDCDNNDFININQIIRFLITKVIEKTGSSKDIEELIKIIALTAYLHWDFGKINIGLEEDLDIRVTKYVNDFMSQCQILGLEIKEEYIRMCMIINCVDTLASSKPEYSDITPLEKKYLGKDPWILFKMNEKYMKYYNLVINKLKEKSSGSKCKI
jgi:hypothetical protein